MAAKKEARYVELVVTVDNHTHQGIPVKKGDSIKVTEDLAAWLTEKWAETKKK